ncbi:MAG: hypothetical protein Q4A70_00760 [Candidatus Saccharibacteria bacterium]|nr:hypothetical protein [Candidatus Saccharibacteria bacterium]
MSKSVVPNTLIISTLTATLTILTGAVLSSTTVQAADSSETVILDVLPTCTLGATGTETHNASTGGSVYIPDIGTSTISAFCNDNAGFAIYAIGFTDDEDGKNVLTDASLGATYDIVTGTATGGATSNWAMKLNLTQDSGDVTGDNVFTLDNGFGDYRTVPSTFTKVAHKNVSTDMTPVTGGVKLTSTYAIFTSPTQPAGSYHGRVKYTLVHPANEVPLQPQTTEAGCIRYYPNGGNVVGTMGCQSISTSATSATLLASNFSREGYGFAGWSTTYDYSDSTGFLGPQEDIAFTAGQYTGSNNGLSLYAHWIKSAGNLQGWTGCPSLQSGIVTALTDQRDGETYAIAKLADGQCWMIENLRLESTAEHNSDGTLSQGYGGQFAGLADRETPDKFSDTYSANSLYSNDGANDTINIGTSNTAYRMPRYNNINTPTTASDRPQNPTTNDATNTTSNASMYSYGNYYTWTAAIADTTDYTSGDHNTTSICPTGWKLPLGSTSTGNIDQGASDPANKVPGFSYLDRKMGGTGTDQFSAEASLRWRKYPVNTVYPGYVDSGSVYIRGTGGLFWSSTAFSSYHAYSLDLGSSFVGPGTDYKYYGGAVRCVVSSV